MFNNKTFVELAKYGVIGIVHNTLVYAIYLLITGYGVDPKLVISITYPAAATFSYFANKQWTFEHEGEHRKSIFRYCIAHIIGYGINILILFYFVNILGFAHQLVQAAAIFIVAGFLFILFRFYVFQKNYKIKII